MCRPHLVQQHAARTSVYRIFLRCVAIMQPFSHSLSEEGVPLLRSRMHSPSAAAATTDLSGRSWGTGVNSVGILANQGLVPTTQFPL